YGGAPLAQVITSCGGAGLQAYRGRDGFAKEVVGDSVHVRIRDGLVLAEPIFDFLGCDVLSTANDQVLDASRYPEVSRRVHARFIAAVQPAVCVDRLSGCGWIVVVPLHHVVTAATQLAALSDRALH